MTKWLMFCTFCAASWMTLSQPVLAFDLNGHWATDASLCDKIFVKEGNGGSFAPNSDQFGGGFIVEGNKVRGQASSCSIKLRKEDGTSIHMIASCATDIMVSNVQFSAKIIDENTIVRVFPEMGDDISMRYSRCPN
jgi:hypothetical protein